MTLRFKLAIAAALIISVSGAYYIINQQDNSSGSALNTGIEMVKSGNAEKAVKEFSAAIKQSPEDPLLYYNRGTAYNLIAEYEKAVADFNKAESLGREDFQLFLNRGRAFAMSGKYKEAAADYSMVIKSRPENPHGYFGRAAALEQLGDKENAARDYRKAAELGHKAAADYIE